MDRTITISRMMSWSTTNRVQKSKSNFLLLFIFVLSVIFQGRNIFIKPFTAYDWRQWDTFSVVRNFRLEGMNPLNPRTNEIYIKKDNPNERLFLLDFPIYSYMAALISYALGLSSFSLRIINIISGAVIAMMLFKSIAELTGNPKAGIISVLLLNLSPLFQFANISMQPDMLMLLFFTMSIYFLLKEKINHPLATGLLTLSVLIKPYILIIVLPLIVYRFLKTKDIKFLFYIAIPLLASTLWLFRGLTSESGNYWYSAQLWVLTLVNTWGFDLLRITAEMFRNISISILTIPIVILSVLGLARINRDLRKMILLLLLGFLIFLLLFIPGNFNHLYYQLPLLIPVYFLASLGISSLTHKELVLLVLALPVYVYPSKMLYENLFKQHQLYLDLNNWPFEQKVIPEGKTIIYYNDEQSPVILNMMGRNGWIYEIRNSDCNTERDRVRDLNPDYVLIFNNFINRENKMEISDDTKIVKCFSDITNGMPKYQDQNITVFEIKK